MRSWSSDCCALCTSRSELQDSHIIPKFVGRHLKATSATGYLRNGENPNIRLQDLKSVKLLCRDCEQLFSTWETIFKENFFDAVKNSAFHSLSYDEWLLKFAVSVSFRTLVVSGDELKTDYPKWASLVDATLRTWRDYLLGRVSRPGETEHHIFVLDMPESAAGKFHPKSFHYFVRAIDASPGVGERVLFVYSKLMRVLIFSPLSPVRPVGWTNTRIFNGRGRLSSPQRIAMPGFGEFLNSRIADIFARPLSERQRQKLKEAMLANPERALASESFKVEELTRRLLKGRKS